MSSVYPLSRRRFRTTRNGMLLSLLRRAYGMTQQELGDAINGVTKFSVCRWEARGQQPHVAHRRQLAQLFAVPSFAKEWGAPVLNADADAQHYALVHARAALARAHVTINDDELRALALGERTWRAPQTTDGPAQPR